jgi:hypothetical protein
MPDSGKPGFLKPFGRFNRGRFNLTEVLGFGMVRDCVRILALWHAKDGLGGVGS